MLNTMKEREKILIETRYNNLVRTNMERNNYVHDLDSWAKTGFATSRSTRKKVGLSASPNLEKLSKIAKGIVPDPSDAKNEEKE